MHETKLAILRALDRNGCSTKALLHLFPEFKDLAEKTLEAHLFELKQLRLLMGHVWRGNAMIYYLMPGAAVYLGTDPKKYRRPPGAQATAEGFIKQVFALRQAPPQFAMSAAEFEEMFPALVVKGVCRTRYYIDATDPKQERLGILVPDFGITSPREVARKVRFAFYERIGKRADPHKGWRASFEARTTQFTVLTPTDAKAARIKNALRNDPFRVVTVTIPEILDFLPQRNNA